MATSVGVTSLAGGKGSSSPSSCTRAAYARIASASWRWISASAAAWSGIDVDDAVLHNDLEPAQALAAIVRDLACRQVVLPAVPRADQAHLALIETLRQHLALLIQHEPGSAEDLA